MMAQAQRASDVVIVGGGLGGLTAAAYLARAGLTVTLYEKAADVGGRARTQAKGEFRFNIGPHAVYKDGAGVPILRDLGVAFSGRSPSASGGCAIRGGRRHALPGGLVSLLSTSLLRLPGKLEIAKLLASFQRIDPRPLQRTSVRDWLDHTIRNSDVRALIQALFRVSTYTNDPKRQSAGLAVEQLQLALSGNVLYLDGGWQTLVDGVRRVAVEAGAEIVCAARVNAIDHDRGVHAVVLADGSAHAAAHVVIAATPLDAAALVPHSSALRAWADTNVPVEAACLDVALARLPQPRSTFALGIDRPLYLSVHSAFAKLAPADGATIHVAMYLNPHDSGEAKANERELEGLLDLMQPGWREVVIERRFLPRLTVCNGLVSAALAGCAGRPGPAVPRIDNLYVAGDWVGSSGLLADASLASAKRVAELIVRSRVPLASAAA